jgi:hypothetical protein
MSAGSRYYGDYKGSIMLRRMGVPRAAFARGRFPATGPLTQGEGNARRRCNAGAGSVHVAVHLMLQEPAHLFGGRRGEQRDHDHDKEHKWRAAEGG